MSITYVVYRYRYIYIDDKDQFSVLLFSQVMHGCSQQQKRKRLRLSHDSLHDGSNDLS